MHFFERVTCTYCRYLAARSYASAVQSSSVTSALIADSPPNDGAKPKISRRKARSPSLSVVQKSRLSNQQAGTSAQTLTETLLAIHENASTLEKIDSSHVQDISTENAGSFTRKQLGSISTRRIARRKRPIKAKASISAKRKAKTTAEVDGINLGSIEAIGKDDLQPTSLSGLPSSLSLDYRNYSAFPANANQAEAIQQMQRLMQPLMQNCLAEALETGSDGAAELERLREFLANSLRVYKSLKTPTLRDKHTQVFQKDIATSKWTSKATSADPAYQAPIPIANSPITITKRAQSKRPQLDVGDNSEPSLLVNAKLPHLNAKRISIEKITPLKDASVATLAHGLERVLFSPGIHWLQDPQSGFYNFPQHVQQVMPKEQFNFEALPRFVKPSMDPDLRELLKRTGKTFAGSTSSLTSAMSQIYYALNGKKSLNTQSPNFQHEPRTFSIGSRLPASILLNCTDEGNYLVDADKSIESSKDTNVLSELGHILEKFLTYPIDEFERFNKDTPNPFAPHESRYKREAYHYTATSDLLMRSQLDCQDARLPKRTFDIKTRATIAIRRDMLNHQQGAGYSITKALGFLESFEREKYDLIRAAFLKYSMQVRIGDMDGIFLAYHSTDRIFGFEYLSLEDLDKALSGSREESSQAFHLCAGILEMILKKAIVDLPNQSLRLSFDAYKDALQVFVSPAGDDNASPLILYDIAFASYLNGQEIPSGQSVDFLSFRPSRLSSSNPSSDFDQREKEATGSGSPQQIEWSVTYDVAVSHNSVLNRERLNLLRKRQLIFTKNVMLPEGLTPQEIEEALSGVNEPKSEEALGKLTDVEDKKIMDHAFETVREQEQLSSETGKFVPIPGISYTARPYGIVPRLRKLAKEGRERLQASRTA